jgi:penicillin-insensitive murein endopeptidase
MIAGALCLDVGLAEAKKAKPAPQKGVKAAIAKSKAKARAARTGKAGAVAVTGSTATPPAPPARDLFGVQKTAAPLAARAIGSYARGCLAGGKMLPVNGPAWQAMRLSRNRNWGHPTLVAYVEQLALDAQKQDGWPGLLVGDLAQPMGGPMTSGHASHQIGLDGDIWLKPMPPKTLTPEERESISAVSVVADDKVSLNPDVWQPGHVKLLKRAASYPKVARIFVHPAIKKGLCEAAGSDRGWLSKVRPWWGHNYHFHVRLSCPPGAAGCEDQPDTATDDGCGKELEGWLKRVSTPIIPRVPPLVKPPMTIDQLPAECAKLVGYEPPPPVPAGPQLPDRRGDGVAAPAAVAPGAGPVTAPASAAPLPEKAGAPAAKAAPAAPPAAPARRS